MYEKLCQELIEHSTENLILLTEIKMKKAEMEENYEAAARYRVALDKLKKDLKCSE